MEKNTTQAIAKSWVAILGDGEAAKKALEDILARYDEPWRHYHDGKHLDMCIGELNYYVRSRYNKTLPTCNKFLVAFLVLVSHDSVYDLKKTNDENVVASAIHGKAICETLGLSYLAQEVHDRFLLTDHKSAPKDEIDKIISDADLSIFGKAKNIFDAYEQNIRLEYHFIPYDQFCKRRAGILGTFLAREHIYYLDHFRQLYEKPARVNLQRSIDNLRNFKA